ncbi:3',5'-cyclic AMP phosphodiesterase CpdA [Sphingobacterium psychroaquaticum]|uniref:3',5'-cyclic AMP phosphodiesterase CpdA n=2 Tax=Sphingobacterium psychroaquaticum TaxID=561061 RepID=A0A1X7KF81_9SPHI|nr:3',5'-cyclic AMP phosphodiesterase CpdA [Sphingobacterium psychroaquaticum]
MLCLRQHNLKDMKNLYWSLLACLVTGTAVGQEVAKGTIYVDENGNGRRDKKEIGLAGVSVSNGRDVVQTDKNGRYALQVEKDNIIFVIKPSGYSIPLDADNQSKFYYIHKPEGSPALKYKGVDATGSLPKEIDFAVVPTMESTKFDAFVFGDPQAYTEEEMAFFKKGVVDEAKNKKGPLFGISLGDLVGDDLTLHPSYRKTIAHMGLPWYHVIGNHDMNLDAVHDSLSDEGFERAFGPANYSFNVGDAHFIVLDDIIYPHPTKGKGYQGGFRKDQLEFVANDLKFVPTNKLVVLAFHIPLNPDNDESFRNEDRQVLFDLLAAYPNTLSLSAHTHFQQQNFYTAAHGWKGTTPHHEFNVGTTSGDWYSGLPNGDGVPTSMMRDGTPKGYAILSIDGNRYTFDYKVVGEDEAYTIGVFGPAVVKAKYAGRYHVYANFFLGSADDKVTYRVNNGAWKTMEKVVGEDPNYVQALLAYDGAKTLQPGRRPSDASSSAHLWKLKLPKLKAGKHMIEIEAIDMFGRKHETKKEIEVVE